MFDHFYSWWVIVLNKNWFCAVLFDLILSNKHFWLSFVSLFLLLGQHLIHDMRKNILYSYECGKSYFIPLDIYTFCRLQQRTVVCIAIRIFFRAFSLIFYFFVFYKMSFCCKDLVVAAKVNICCALPWFC